MKWTELIVVDAIEERDGIVWVAFRCSPSLSVIRYGCGHLDSFLECVNRWRKFISHRRAHGLPLAPPPEKKEIEIVHRAPGRGGSIGSIYSCGSRAVHPAGSPFQMKAGEITQALFTFEDMPGGRIRFTGILDEVRGKLNYHASNGIWVVSCSMPENAETTIYIPGSDRSEDKTAIRCSDAQRAALVEALMQPYPPSLRSRA